MLTKLLPLAIILVVLATACGHNPRIKGARFGYSIDYIKDTKANKCFAVSRGLIVAAVDCTPEVEDLIKYAEQRDGTATIQDPNIS